MINGNQTIPLILKRTGDALYMKGEQETEHKYANVAHSISSIFTKQLHQVHYNKTCDQRATLAHTENLIAMLDTLFVRTVFLGEHFLQ